MAIEQRVEVKGGDNVLVEWTPELDCGNETIDIQHRSILAEAAKLLQSARRKAPDTLSRYDELLSHVVGHFRDEEECLRVANYEGLERHRRLHATLTDDALRLREEILAGRQAYAALLQFLVYDVVENHLLVEDRDFYSAVKQVPGLRSRGSTEMVLRPSDRVGPPTASTC